jgi:drug/metabolite transporter (DMT)-like permease
MLNFILYAATTLIWGSTWLGIKLQLTQVPPILSVSYRFCLAAAILLSYCLITRKKLGFSWIDQVFMAIQGVTLFGLGYCMSYLATCYLTSGLVAVVFSTIMMWNILNLRIFMQQPVAGRALVGGIMGLIGICILFRRDLAAFTATRGLIGLSIALGGAYLASLGNVVGSRNAARGLPVTQTNAYGMLYGGLLTLAIHAATGGGLVMDWSCGYLLPVLYLTLFGSIVAFGCYMLLIGRIGAEYAAYVLLLAPVIALLLSTAFEDFRWGLGALLGVCIVLCGNLVILTPASLVSEVSRRIGPLRSASR